MREPPFLSDVRHETGGRRTSFHLRPSRPDDRDALYAICLATGHDGDDASDRFADPHLLGHRYVGPYLDLEPDLAFTLEDDEGPCGYVLGTDDTLRFHERFVSDWLPPLLDRVEPPSPDRRGWTDDDRLRAELHAPTLTLPADLPAYPAHLHIDLLPRAQGQGQGRRMIATLLEALASRGVPGVHLGVSARNRRAQGFYAAVGFVEVQAADPDDEAVLMARSLP